MEKLEIEFDTFLKNVGRRIKEKRNESGLTQEDLDEGQHPIDVKYIQRIEAGRNITLWTLFKIAKKLKASPKDFLDF